VEVVTEDTDRLKADGPFRRLIIDGRLGDDPERSRVAEIVTHALGDRADAADLIVFVTKVRGGVPKWFVLATSSEGKELPREILDRLEETLGAS
jgi:hypothetical protein